MIDGLRELARTGRSAAKVLRQPTYVTPGHFYSPTSTPQDAERAEAWKSLPVLRVDLRERHQLALVPQLDLRPPSGRWRPNRMFGGLDAALLDGMIRRFGPSRIVEVGSGWSTAVMLDADPDVPVTCVEPYPDRLWEATRAGDERRLTVLERGVQDVDLDLFRHLGADDILFIDSTHVVKAGSDVVWLFFHVLPLLAPGVLVHVHDVHWPFEYPAEWLRQRRDWTEAYLLRALLMGSVDWQVEVMGSWLAEVHPEVLPERLRGPHTGSVWLRRV